VHARQSYNGPSEEGRTAMTERTEQRGDPEVGVCHVCGREFATQLALSQHLMDEHDEELLPDQPIET
jgi:hypothetical protein